MSYRIEFLSIMEEDAEYFFSDYFILRMKFTSQSFMNKAKPEKNMSKSNVY